MPVPMHERSHAGLFGSIFIDIGDEQSIEDDLSTYSSHLTNMKTMMKSCNERSLILNATGHVFKDNPVLDRFAFKEKITHR